MQLVVMGWHSRAGFMAPNAIGIRLRAAFTLENSFYLKVHSSPRLDLPIMGWLTVDA